MHCSSAAVIPGKDTPALVCVCLPGIGTQLYPASTVTAGHCDTLCHIAHTMQADLPAPGERDLSCCKSKHPRTLRIGCRTALESTGYVRGSQRALVIKHLGQKARGIEALEGNLPVVCIVLNGVNCAGHALHGQAQSKTILSQHHHEPQTCQIDPGLSSEAPAGLQTRGSRQ